MTAVLMRPFWVLLCFSATISFATAAPVTTEEKPKSETPFEKTKKALDQAQDFEIADQGLVQAFASLKDSTKINFVVDYNVIINYLGVDPNQMVVSVKQKNAKVKTVVRNILNQHNLNYVILGDTVVVTTEDMAMQRQMRQRVSVDLDAVPLNTALKQLARETGMNLLLDPKLKKETETAVTLQLDDVPLDSAVRLLTEMAGVKPVRMGNVVFVTSKARAIEIRSDPEFGGQGGPGGQPISYARDEIIKNVWQFIAPNPALPIPVPQPAPPQVIEPPAPEKVRDEKSK